MQDDAGNCPQTPDSTERTGNAKVPAEKPGKKRAILQRFPLLGGMGVLIPPAAFIVLMLFYIWVAAPRGLPALKIPLFIILLIFPFASHILYREGCAEVGIRMLSKSALLSTTIATVCLVAILLLIARIGSGEFFGGKFFKLYDLFNYYPWAFYQQYALQVLIYRRLRDTLRRPIPVTLAAAGVFALLHAPNVVLVIATLIAGCVWCRLYERDGNLFLLAFSHVLLALIIRASWPPEWLHTLIVGPNYWNWQP